MTFIPGQPARGGFHRHFVEFSGTTDNPTVAITAGDTAITVSNGGLFAVGNHIAISEGASDELSYPVIKAIATNLLTLNRPLDNSYTTAAVVEIVDPDLNVSGSLATPVIAKIKPNAGELLIVYRVLVHMLDSTEMDDAKFGGMTEIANGLILRAKVGGVFRTGAHMSTNGDIASHAFDVEYAAKAPAGKFGLRGRWTFAKSGFAIYLNGDDEDELQMLIQDDLTGLDGHHWDAQGVSIQLA